jgi:hypothetical protein
MKLGFRNYAFLANAIRQFASGGLVVYLRVKPLSFAKFLVATLCWQWASLRESGASLWLYEKSSWSRLMKPNFCCPV